MTTASPQNLTADALLKIDAGRPEQLFPRSADAIKSIYRDLVKKWHPDHNKDPKAGDVFGHLTKLKDKAEEKLASATWQESGYFSCRLANGKTFRVRSDASRPFDLGTMYIGPTNVTFVVKKDYADLFKNAVAAIKKIKFADDKMKKAYGDCLPVTNKVFEAEDALILTVRKRPEEVLLRDAMPFLKKKDLDRHTAWITSRLHEIARLLDYNGLTHNAITPDSVFISPPGHSAALLGGWWYAGKVGSKLAYATGEAMDFLPDDGSPITARQKTDLEMVKATAREVLGDRGGTRLTTTKPAPAQMIDYLRLPSSGDPQQDLEEWYQKILPKSFGARRFTKLKVTYSDVYQPGS